MPDTPEPDIFIQRGAVPGWLIQALKGGAILVVAFGVAVYLLRSPVEVDTPPQDPVVNAVEVTLAKSKAHAVWVDAMGTVKPARAIDLHPQVSGEIIKVSEAFIPGAIVEKGEELVWIDPVNFKVNLENRRANLAFAQRDLLVEQGKARSAKLIEDSTRSVSMPEAVALRLREPQLAAAEANLAAAKEYVLQAERDLEDTTVITPFPAMILSKDVGLGENVGAGTRVCRLVGISKCWIELSIPVRSLLQLKIPGYNADVGDGSKAQVTMRLLEGQPVLREGKLLRLLGELDPAGRMARLLVEVENPLGLSRGEQPRTYPLLFNSYVRVGLEGKTFPEAFELDRAWVTDDDQAYVALPDNTLGIRKLEILWRYENTLLVRGGLADGDRIIKTHLTTPIPGMKLRVIGAEPSVDKKSVGILADDAATMKEQR